MKSKLISLFKKNSLITIYLLVLILLINGVYVISGAKYFGLLSLFFCSLIVSYILMIKLGMKNIMANWLDKKSVNLSQKTIDIIAYSLLGFCLVTVMLHFLYMGGSPPFMASKLESTDDVARMRRNLTKDVPGYINYISAFNIRAFLPFLIFYFLIKKKHLIYYVLLIVGCFYAFSLMQKSYVIGVLAPVFVYNLLAKKYLMLIKYTGIMVLIVVGQSFTASPEIRAEIELNEIAEHMNDPISEHGDTLYVDGDTILTHRDLKIEGIGEQGISKEKGLAIIISSIWKRITVVPGEIVSKWFDAIPKYKPFLNGDGYRIISALKGRKIRNYSLELYPLFYPDYIQRGLHGSVNTASFMYDFANFGRIGLVYSGFLLALMLVFVESLFGSNFRMKLCLNFFAILILSSAALTTSLLSGGWGLILLMYFLLLKTNNSEIKKKQVLEENPSH